MSQQQATLPFDQLADQNFVHFKGNDAVVNVLQQPDTLPQFCYLWGGKSTGKSHILAALSGCLSQLKINYFAVDANQLLQLDLAAVLPQNLQFLLIDDIHLLANTEQGELVLFNLFNHCKSHSIKLLVTAEIHAKDAAWHLPDLVSRLSSGLTLGLEPLKGELALVCIEQKFELNGIRVDGAVMQYLQAYQSSYFPDLFQLFLKVAVESLKFKRKVTVPLIKQVLKNLDNKDSLA